MLVQRCLFFLMQELTVKLKAAVDTSPCPASWSKTKEAFWPLFSSRFSVFALDQLPGHMFTSCRLILNNKNSLEILFYLFSFLLKPAARHPAQISFNPCAVQFPDSSDINPDSLLSVKTLESVGLFSLECFVCCCTRMLRFCPGGHLTMYYGAALRDLRCLKSQISNQSSQNTTFVHLKLCLLLLSTDVSCCGRGAVISLLF